MLSKFLFKRSRFQVKFFRPKAIRTTYGSVFDYKGDLVDLKARGLDGICNEDTKEKHAWLLLPYEEGQKEYVMCLNCGERSHL